MHNDSFFNEQVIANQLGSSEAAEQKSSSEVQSHQVSQFSV
jgi:hypothetical protein